MRVFNRLMAKAACKTAWKTSVEQIICVASASIAPTGRVTHDPSRSNAVQPGIVACLQGDHPGWAIEKPENSKPGATVQPTNVQFPRLSACCQWLAGTIAWGRSPISTSGPRKCRSTRPPAGGAMDSSSVAPVYQCQVSTAFTLCQREITPAGSKK